MWRARESVRRTLDRGGALVCADGWFTDWVPGHRWVHDNSHPTCEVRYRIGVDRHRLLDGIDLDQFIFSHGVSGWWACGYLESPPHADVLLEDTWGRPVMVLDEDTTAGRMLLTASGPLAEGYGGETDLQRFWQRALVHLSTPRPPKAARSIARHEAYEGPIPENPGARIGLVFNGVWSHWAFATSPKYRSIYRLLYVHELDYARIRDLDALVIPFQSDHAALLEKRAVLDRFLALGRKIAVFGDSRPEWMGAVWENRPVDNWWWQRDPSSPPLVDTDRSHPLYGRLEPRHS